MFLHYRNNSSFVSVAENNVKLRMASFLNTLNTHFIISIICLTPSSDWCSIQAFWWAGKIGCIKHPLISHAAQSITSHCLILTWPTWGLCILCSCKYAISCSLYRVIWDWRISRREKEAQCSLYVQLSLLLCIVWRGGSTFTIMQKTLVHWSCYTFAVHLQVFRPFAKCTLQI